MEEEHATKLGYLKEEHELRMAILQKNNNKTKTKTKQKQKTNKQTNKQHHTNNTDFDM